MACRRLREKMAARQPAFGCWTSLSDPAVVEMIANAGFDYVSIDMEHSPLNLETVISHIRTAQSCGISALVRAPGSDPGLIGRVVDMGPDGIYIPHVHSADDARRAVGITKFAPVGDRGATLHSRAAGYGTADPDYKRRVNEHLILWLQIEEESAVDDIESITATPGVDVCGIAPHDLARSLQCKANANDERLMAAVRRVVAVVKARDSIRLAVPATVFGVDGALALGADLVNVTDATQVLATGLRDRLRIALTPKWLP